VTWGKGEERSGLLGWSEADTEKLERAGYSIVKRGTSAGLGHSLKTRSLGGRKVEKTARAGQGDGTRIQKSSLVKVKSAWGVG